MKNLLTFQENRTVENEYQKKKDRQGYGNLCRLISGGRQRSAKGSSVVSFDEVRDAVDQDWKDDRRQQFNEDYYESLRSRYEIVVEPESLGSETDVDRDAATPAPDDGADP